ncbi:MAG: glycosyltransferase, partial [Gammaproteobacteria bacterium]|nr:glycosyltransferase [Gammaproteobacteria bacterium]
RQAIIEKSGTMSLEYSLSIVTPTYNRKDVIVQSIESSLQLIKAGIAEVLIVIDDCSTDGTLALLLAKYAQEISDGLIILQQLPANLGVTGAKNAGAMLAKTEWIAFMDSDDCFVVENALLLRDVLLTSPDSAVFFRCRDHKQKQLIGPKRQPVVLHLPDLINLGTPGECLPVVRSSAIKSHLYPVELRGSEALSYYAILADGGSILLSDIVAREYEDDASDRLSSKAGLRKRARLLVIHNLRCLRYWRAATLKTAFGWVARIVYYSLLHLRNKLA